MRVKDDTPIPSTIRSHYASLTIVFTSDGSLRPLGPPLQVPLLMGKLAALVSKMVKEDTVSSAVRQ